MGDLTHLGHDDGTSAAARRRVPLKVLHPRDHLGDVDLCALLVPLERRPQKHRVLVEKPAAKLGKSPKAIICSVLVPPWHSPKLPLPADVGPGPEDDEEVLLLGHPDEPGQVEEGGEVPAAIAEVEDPLLRLVEVPWDVTEDLESILNP